MVKHKWNVVYRGLYSYRQRVLVITLSPNIFFFALFPHVEYPGPRGFLLYYLFYLEICDAKR